MPQVKTSDLNDIALDWAVTLIEKPEACEYGVEDWRSQRRHTVKDGEYLYRWHQSWMQAGPIIEREDMNVTRHTVAEVTESGQEIMRRVGWSAHTTTTAYWMTPTRQYGPTPLTAAMRCYVASKLGDTVEIPEELL